MAKDIDKMINALSAKKVPVATLDTKWHKLFTKVVKTPEVEEYEGKLNELLKKQGRVNNEVKEIKRVKKELMDEIVNLMDDDNDSKVEKVKEKIDRCNEEIDSHNDELMELPKQIAEVNKQLMIHTMETCYDELKENEKGIDELAKWLANIRIELKKNVVRKQEYEIANQEIYSYMHDIFGAEVIDLFDMKYNPSDNPIKKNSES